MSLFRIGIEGFVVGFLGCLRCSRFGSWVERGKDGFGFGFGSGSGVGVVCWSDEGDSSII